MNFFDQWPLKDPNRLSAYLWATQREHSKNGLRILGWTRIYYVWECVKVRWVKIVVWRRSRHNTSFVCSTIKFLIYPKIYKQYNWNWGLWYELIALKGAYNWTKTNGLQVCLHEQPPFNNEWKKNPKSAKMENLNACFQS